MYPSYVDVAVCFIIPSRISFGKLTSAKTLIHQFPKHKHKLPENVQFSYDLTCCYGYAFVIQPALSVKVFPKILRMNYRHTTNIRNDSF